MTRRPPHWIIRQDLFLKPTDSWLDILFLDHIEVPLVKALSRTGITPTQVTIASIGLRIGAAVAFVNMSILMGAFLYVLGLILDGVDGKLARLTNTSNARGGQLDLTADYGLFVALWVTLGISVNVAPWLLAGGAAAGVSSAFATVTSGESRINAVSRPSGRSMVQWPGVIELHFLTFALAPILGDTAVIASMIISTCYFTAAWLLKVSGVWRSA